MFFELISGARPIHERGKLFLLIALGFLMACSANYTPEEHIARAAEFMKKGDIGTAGIELKSAVQQDPNNADARLELGRLYVDLGDGASAEKELERAAKIEEPPAAVVLLRTRALLLQTKLEEIAEQDGEEPNGPEGLTSEQRLELRALRGHALYALGKIEDAEKRYDEVLAESPALPDALLGKASIAVFKHKLVDARQHLSSLVKAHPQFAAGWSLLADVDRFEEKGEGAAQHYDKALEYERNNLPFMAENRSKRALTRIALKNYAGALEDAGVVAKLVATDARAPYIRGLVAFEQKKYGDAQTEFEDALRKAPHFVAAKMYLGTTLVMRGAVEQGEVQLQAVVAQVPGLDQARQMLAAVRLKKGNFAGARELLAPMLARYPEDVKLLNLMASAAIGLGEIDQGVKYLEKAAATQPDSSATRKRMGLALLTQGDTTRGYQELENAIDLAPNDQQLRVTLISSYLHKRDFEKAIGAVQQWQTQEPKNPSPFVMLAGIYRVQGKLDDARTAYASAIDVAPGDPSASHGLAGLKIADGDFEGARALYDGVLAKHPDHLRTMLELAELDSREKNYDSAVKRLDEIIAKYPKESEPRLMLGRYYLSTGQTSKVLPALGELPSLVPNQPEVLGLVGETYLALGQPASAIEPLQKLVKVLPRAADAYYLLAKAYAATGDAANTGRTLKHALENNPNHLRAKIAMVRFMQSNNDATGASRLMEELKRSDPENPELIAQAGWLAAQQDRPQEAVVALASAMEQAPTAELSMALADAQWKSADKDGAIKTLKKWTESHPGDVQVWSTLATRYIILGKDSEAVDALTNVLKSAPEQSAAHNNLAWLLRNRDPARAVEHAEKALRLEPENPNIMDTASVVYLAQGNTAKALELIKDARRKAPQDPVIQFHLAQVLAKTGDKLQALAVIKELPAEYRANSEVKALEKSL